MHVIGLTGGIACGKSTLSGELRRQGAWIVDGDILSRELTAPGGPAHPALREAFGDSIFYADGTLDRRALGSRVFGDKRALARLDAIMQPLLRQLILRDIQSARDHGAKVCVLDMPLLYEKGLDALCEAVWCVYLPEEEQLRRLMARDHLGREEAARRVGSQIPVAEKAARANVALDNSGTEEELREKGIALYRTLL